MIRSIRGSDRPKFIVNEGISYDLMELNQSFLNYLNFGGYPDERFRDRGLLLFSVEYRWPVWADKSINALGVDAVLFVDAGQVFEDAQDIAMAPMAYSYGIGLRGAAFGHYFGSMDIGFSEEGFQFVISSRQSFQASSASLFRGSNPVPER